VTQAQREFTDAYFEIYEYTQNAIKKELQAIEDYFVKNPEKFD